MNDRVMAGIYDDKKLANSNKNDKEENTLENSGCFERMQGLAVVAVSIYT